MAKTVNWGILATGNIAHAFAKGVNASKTGKLVAVGSRSIESATKFTNQHGGTPFASYEEVLADPSVEAVYIATPHHLHSEWTIKCAKAKKAILCEKPFTLNALEAEKVLSVVKEEDVFFMEAFMYRCHPFTRNIKQIIEDGSIGEVLNINAEFGFHAPEDWGNFRANGAVGGGGLMDVGTYCVSFMRLIVGEEPSETKYSANITDRGYDAHGSGLLKFPSGVTGHFGTGIHAGLKNDVRVYGTKGWLHVEGPWVIGKESKVTVYKQGSEPVVVSNTLDSNLYAIEADTVAEFLESKECPYVSVQDTLGQMRTLDGLRADAGLVFADEMRS